VLNSTHSTIVDQDIHLPSSLFRSCPLRDNLYTLSTIIDSLSSVVMIEPIRQPLWQPHDVSKTNIDRFRRYVNQKHGLDLQTYNEIHAWSVNADTMDHFWRDALGFLEVCNPEQLKLGPALARKVTMPRIPASDTKIADPTLLTFIEP
jgi:hypothetical protein